MKWFTPSSNNFLLLAIKGIDEEIVEEIVLLLNAKARPNIKEDKAESLAEMMDVMFEFANPKPCDNDPYNKLEVRKNETFTASEPTAFMATVDEKIEENLNNEEFKCSNLAKLLCCCEMQLYRKLKQLTQLSTANYIRRYRLRRSLRSLQQTDLPISQICFNVGFHSLEYFSRSFKKEFGISPTTFRFDGMLK